MSQSAELVFFDSRSPNPAWIISGGAAEKTSVSQLIASGGRVLNVTATAPSVTGARAAAYAVVDAIDFPTGFCRRDIGWREEAREQQG